jgi:hypothetical protein
LTVNDATFNFWWSLRFVWSIMTSTWVTIWFEYIITSKWHFVGNVTNEINMTFVFIWTWTVVDGSSIRISVFSNMSGSWLFLTHCNAWIRVISTRRRTFDRRELIFGTKIDNSFDSVEIFIFVVSSRFACMNFWC